MRVWLAPLLLVLAACDTLLMAQPAQRDDPCTGFSMPDRQSND